MKRTLCGKYEVIGIYSVCNMKTLFVLSWNLAKIWEDKKSKDAIALCWNGKLYFRQLYYRNRRDGLCFKFFNQIIYLEDIMACNEVIIFE